MKPSLWAKEGDVEMEHRRDSRTNASINLLIYNSGLPIAIGITRDISTGGMFVQTNYGDVGPGSILEFDLLYSRKTPNTRTRYRAVITEQRNDGLALQFDATSNHDARKLAAMVEWVAHAHEASSHAEAIHGTTHQRKTLRRLVSIPEVARSVR